MSAAHEAVDAVQFLLYTGAATDLARAMGTAFAQGVAAERDKLDKEGAAAQLADALEAVIGYAESRAEDMNENVEAAAEEGCGAGEIQTAATLRDKAWAAIEQARAALRAAGRLP